MKKWILGILAILTAIGTFLGALLDDNPETKPDLNQAIQGVSDGVQTISKPEEGK